MTDVIGKIEQLSSGESVLMLKPGFEIMDPKSMAPGCKGEWDWYVKLPNRIRDATKHGNGYELYIIADEIETHAVAIEYLCRI